MATLVAFIKRVWTSYSPPSVGKSSDPINFGILGAAAIAPWALILPARCNPHVVIYAVAARDEARAQIFARKHGINKVYSGAEGYQQLLDDPAIHAVYNPLPNGLHYEWTMKALAAGKHVLLEKPAANTAEETAKMFELAERKGLVLLEAFHYRFHPANLRVKEILDSGELGAIKTIDSALGAPRGTFRAGDIRLNYELGGGAMMDMGCYTLNTIRYFSSSDPTSVLEATATPLSTISSQNLIDTRTTATLALPADATATLTCDLAIPRRLGFIPRMPLLHVVVRCEGGDVELFNFIMPTPYHWIQVRRTDGQTRTEKAYSFKDGKGPGEDWWTTYHHQLFAFVEKIQGKTPRAWVSKEDSVANAHWIEEIYKKTGLGSRKPSTFVFHETPEAL